MIKKLLWGIGYPAWVITESIRGTITRSVRDACYRNFDVEYSWWNLPGRIWNTLEATSVCETASDAAFNVKLSTYIWMAGTVATIGSILRNKAASQVAHRYTQLTDAEIRNFSPGELVAFEAGAKAGSSWLPYLKESIGRVESWRHPVSYYAGFGASYNNDNGLIQRVKHAQLG